MTLTRQRRHHLTARRFTDAWCREHLKRWPLVIVDNETGKAWGAIYWVRAATLAEALAKPCPYAKGHWEDSGWKA